MVKEKRDFLVQVSVKTELGDKHYDLKRYVEVELDWQKNKGVFVDTVAEKEGVISFSKPNGGLCKFRLINLEVEKNWKKSFFKDHVRDWKLEPIQDEISEKIVTYWGTRVEPTQYRIERFLVVIGVVMGLIGSIIAFILWKKKRSSK